MALSKPTSDQSQRLLSSWITFYLLLFYVTGDLLWHYCVKIRYDYLHGEAPDVTMYHGIMSTTSSLAAFYLKIALFVIEAFKYAFSFDYSPVYDELRDSYVNADSSKLPGASQVPVQVEEKQEGALATRVSNAMKLQ
jgi:hypothetical protein